MIVEWLICTEKIVLRGHQDIAVSVDRRRPEERLTDLLVAHWLVRREWKLIAQMCKPREEKRRLMMVRCSVCIGRLW